MQGRAADIHRERPGTARAILTIDLGAIADNWRTMARMSGSAICAAVVKADAYGLGLAPVCGALWRAGCRTFFVATLDEGLKLRDLLAEARIFVLDGCTVEQAPIMAFHDLVPVISSRIQIEAWYEGAGGGPLALQIDTGMTRLGIGVDDVSHLFAGDCPIEREDIALVMSHLACADEPDHPMNAAQRDAFAACRTACGLDDIPASLANSGGIELGGSYLHDMTRPGIALYGGRAVTGRIPSTKPVVRLDARVLQLRGVEAGVHVGYSATFETAGPTVLATVACGYADGYPRALSSRANEPGAIATFAGVEAHVAGRVSMDMTTFDVSAAFRSPTPPSVEAVEWIELIGTRPGTTIDDLAERAGTIGYEILTRLGQRAHRVYLGGAE